LRSHMALGNTTWRLVVTVIVVVTVVRLSYAPSGSSPGAFFCTETGVSTKKPFRIARNGIVYSLSKTKTLLRPQRIFRNRNYGGRWDWRS